MKRAPVVAAWVLALAAAPAARGQVMMWPVEWSVLSAPVRLASDGAGGLVVSDYGRRSVCIMNPATLTITRRIVVDGNVTGVAAANGRIYAGNETAARIEVYGPDGALQGVLGGNSTVVGDPTDLAADEAARLLFALDGRDNIVKVFSLEGEGSLVRTIAGPGLSEGTFQRPTSLAIDAAAGEVLVTDFGDVERGLEPRVLIFGYDGAYRQSISGSNGASGYFFSKPQGVAVGENGHVLVGDAWLGRVVVMDRASGAEVGRIGEYGPARGQLKLPLDLLVLGDSRDLYVTSGQTRRIEVFAEGGRK